MIRLQYYKVKRVKLNDVIPYGKNLLNINIFFNYKKYRRKKWNIQRGRTLNNLFYMFKIYRRYNLNDLYFIFCPENLLNTHAKPYTFKVKNIFDYRTFLELRYRLLKFFYFLRFKQLKKLLVHRHFAYKFDSFDNNLILLLMRLGFILDFRRARWYLKYCGIRKNRRVIQDPFRSLNFTDILKMPRYFQLPYTFRFVRYIKKKKKYKLKKKRTMLTWFNKMRILLFTRWSKSKFELLNYSNDLIITRILPMPFPINYSTMSLFFMPFEMKNQWTFFYNMFFIKKFLQYGR